MEIKKWNIKLLNGDIYFYESVVTINMKWFLSKHGFWEEYEAGPAIAVGGGGYNAGARLEMTEVVVSWMAHSQFALTKLHRRPAPPFSAASRLPTAPDLSRADGARPDDRTKKNHANMCIDYVAGTRAYLHRSISHNTHRFLVALAKHNPPQSAKYSIFFRTNCDCANKIYCGRPGIQILWFRFTRIKHL